MMEKLTIPSACGGKRPFYVFRPEGEAKQSLLIVHGMSEHFIRYAPLAEYLNALDVAVCGLDLPGHGPDTPPDKLGYFCASNGEMRVLQDIQTAFHRMREIFPDAKPALMGHSMGSFFSRAALQMGLVKPDAAIICGTGKVEAPAAYAAYAVASVSCLLGQTDKPNAVLNSMIFARSNQAFAPAKTSMDWLSRDEEQVRKYMDDPYCGFAFTSKAYRDFFSLLLRLLKLEKAFQIDKSLPLFFISGGRDPVGGFGKGVEEVASLYRAHDQQAVKVKIYPEARHELTNEINRQEVYEDIAGFLKTAMQGDAL